MVWITSTVRLSIMKKKASTSVVPCRIGRSRRKMALFSRKPVPGQANTVSIRIEPPIRLPACRPITARQVGAAFFRTWNRIWRSFMPLA